MKNKNCKLKNNKSKNNKCVSIGGQAVIEGVMMRSPNSMATAVIDQSNIIRLETKRFDKKKNKFFSFPIVRGVVSFLSSLISGSKILMRSAEVFGESEPSKFEKWCAKTLKVNVLSVVSFFSMIIGFALAVALFIFAPQKIRELILGNNCNLWAKNFFEGGLKLFIFILYIVFCSLIKDVKRTFMYHGAEHKTISCYELGYELTPQNAKKCSRVHNRCGTTFIVFVMVISIILFAVFESVVPLKLNGVVRVLFKIALLPLVAGLSYELLKGLAKTNNPIFLPLKIPGLLLQRLTTKEPDEKMLLVAITAFKMVLEMDSNQELKEKSFDDSVSLSVVLDSVKKTLAQNGIEESAEAEWICSLSLNIKRDELNSDILVTKEQLQKINSIVGERITHRPLWYCIGDTDFYGYKIKVDERVLIPRPETELLVENAKKFLTKDSSVLDLCTGSGAIAIALNKEIGCKTVASDISKKAISLAKENAQLNNAQVTFIKSDLFKNISGKFDCIISNPPYIKNSDINTLEKEVKDFEPKLALCGGEDGLDFYRKIIVEGKKHLVNGGTLLLEVGINQAQEVKKLLKDYSFSEIILDLENIERIVRAVYNV